LLHRQSQVAAWRGADGEVIAASGLRITPRDLARIGITLLGGGRWGGRQVIPAEWLSASLQRGSADCRWQTLRTPMVSMADGATLRREEMISASPNGGQRPFRLPQRDLAVVVTAGNYETLRFVATTDGSASRCAAASIASEVTRVTRCWPYSTRSRCYSCAVLEATVVGIDAARASAARPHDRPT
jgi:CubicO group peptidase (beta-lactamase class C family)